MRTGLLLAVLLLASPTASRSDSSVPPPPPFRRSNATVLLASDFREGGMHGWRPDQPAYWQVENGALCATLPERKQVHSLIVAGSPQWTDYALDLDLCAVRGVDRGAAVRVDGKRGIGVDLRGPGYDDVLLHRDRVQLGRAATPNANGRWHHLRIEARGQRYRVFVNHALVLDRTDRGRAHPRGGIALAAYTGGVGQCRVCFANVVVTALP